MTLSASDGVVDRSLSALYDSDRTGTLGSSSPNVARWLGDIRAYFPASVVQFMQHDALERLNLRHLDPGGLPESVHLIVADLSFISLLKVAPALLPHLAPGGYLLPLIKPQFEAGRGQVGKGGIVRDESVRRAAIESTLAGLEALGLRREGLIDSPVAGAEGNREALALLRRST